MSERIRIATAADRPTWDTFVARSPHGTPFHMSAWSQVICSSLGHRARHLLAERDGRIVGVLPLVAIASGLTGTRLVSTPLAGYGGPIAEDPGIADALVARACTLTRALGAGHLELHFEAERRVARAAVGMRRTGLYAGFRGPLPGSPEEVVPGLPRKQRRMPGLARKAGLETRMLRLEPGAERPAPGWLTAAHRLVAGSMHDLGTPSYPLALLRGLLERDPERWFVWAAYDGERMAAAVWVARHGGVLYPHISGDDPGYRRVAVNNLLYVALMEQGVRDGATEIDYGRSKVGTGPYHFKRHLGFEPRHLGYRYYLAAAGRLPSISPANPRYALAIRMWQRLPHRITRTLGPALVGHFA